MKKILAVLLSMIAVMILFSAMAFVLPEGVSIPEGIEESERKKVITKDEYENLLKEEGFAGTYLENGTRQILLKNGSIATERLQEILQSTHAQLRYVRYSYQELIDAFARISTMRTQENRIVQYGINLRENVVEVHVVSEEDAAASSIDGGEYVIQSVQNALIRGGVDVERIRIFDASEEIVSVDAASGGVAQAKHNLETGKVGNIALAAKQGAVAGFVSYAHGTQYGDRMGLSAGTAIGTVTSVVPGNDCSFTTTNADVTINNVLPNNIALAGWGSAEAGDTVTKFSRLTPGGVSGTVLQTGVERDFNFPVRGSTATYSQHVTGLMSATYASQGGDSGGTVVFYYLGNPYFVGMHNGSVNSSNGYHYAYAVMSDTLRLALNITSMGLDGSLN